MPEPSGLVASREHEGVYWTIGDSGAAPQVFAFTAASDAYFTVDEAENTIHEALP